MLQDAGLKLYGGGDHDLEGQGLLNFFFIAGVLLSLAVLRRALKQDEHWVRAPKINPIRVFLILLLGHLLLFSGLGIGHYVGSYVE